MKIFAIACIIALTLCAGCENSGNTGEKSAVTSHTQKVAETTTEAVTIEEITTEESTEENTTEEVTTTASTTEPDEELTVTTETNETTTNVSTMVTADNAGTVTTTTTSVADNARAVDTPVTTNNLPDVENFISFEELEEGENVDIPENITGNEELQDETDSGVIELPFIPLG
ncbi:MAG: hypothetical protein K2H28_00540 [Ruminococcus sp.]|nr:hypothetical protein [Ruminococcus sp.]